MKYLTKLTLTVAFVLSFVASYAQPTTTVTWESSVVELGENQYEIRFKGDILKGWHTYDLNSEDSSTVITFETTPGAELVGKPYEVTKSHRYMDEIFEVEMGEYMGEVIFAQKVALKGEGATIKGNINWRSCEGNNCNSPEDWGFEVTIGNPEAAAAATVAAADTTTPTTEEGATVAAAEETTESSSLLGLILGAIGWGLLALLTPCVFPMIPMTVSFFLKGATTPAAGRFKAIMYGVFIVMLYTLPIAAIILITRVLGGDAVTADIFNWIATHWLPNLIFFTIFMIFAASFFGAFEITLPSSVVNKSDANADKGGLVGIFFMALTLVLVSFSCTGPIVGTAIIGATSGAFWAPILTMLVFSTTFAIPFTLFALFPSLLKNLPKSGGWLNSVKVVLGFIEVALGFKFLSVADQTYHWGLMDREVYLAVWIVVFTLLGLYLLGKLKFAHDSDLKHITVTRLALAVASLSFVVYLLPGMWGAPLKALSGYMPPMSTQDFVLGAGTSNSADSKMQGADGETIKYADFLHLPHGLSGYFDYEQALAAAQKQGKPLFVDVTGHGCVNCREMESRVWSDPRVLEILSKNYVIVALYTDDKKVVEEEDWITDPSTGTVYKDLGRISSYIARTKFDVNAQPNYVLVGANGEAMFPARGYNLDTEAFIEFLNSGIEAYNASK